jgi:hypothetical protein
VQARRDLPDRPADRDLQGARDLPRGSLADLRQRLERLPQDHPSSLHNGSHADRRHSAEPESELAGDASPDGPERDYWNQVPRFERLWAAHAERWPGDPTDAKVDRSRDPAGSWRGSGNQYLTPDQHAKANEVIEAVRAAEKPLSEHMREIERDNTAGSRLAGWAHRLKGPDRLKEKLAERAVHQPGRSPEDSMRGINDAIRYTFCSAATTYKDAYWDIKGKLEDHGYKMIYSKNHWRDDPEYKGVNTRWITPEGQRFEVQFHTAESFHAKQQITHDSYERVRNPLVGRAERRDLEAFQQQVSGWIAAPHGVANIPDLEEAG